MRSTKQEYVPASGTTTTAYPWIPVDHHVENFNVSYAVSRAGAGNITYSVQYTLDNLDPSPTAISAVAMDHVSGKTETFGSNITIPCNAVRLFVAGVSGLTGVIAFTVLQAGN